MDAEETSIKNVINKMYLQVKCINVIVYSVNTGDSQLTSSNYKGW